MRRMDHILGRSDDMLIVRGVNIFPRQIEELIVAEPALSAHYRIDVHRRGARDELVITAELARDCAETARQAAGAQLRERMKSRYGLSADIIIAESGTLARFEGKAKRVFDHRKDIEP
jgi:phenylacetate-CoA ligase